MFISIMNRNVSVNINDWSVFLLKIKHFITCREIIE
jgi:hypothetical protein